MLTTSKMLGKKRGRASVDDEIPNGNIMRRDKFERDNLHSSNVAKSPKKKRRRRKEAEELSPKQGNDVVGTSVRAPAAAVHDHDVKLVEKDGETVNDVADVPIAETVDSEQRRTSRKHERKKKKLAKVREREEELENGEDNFTVAAEASSVAAIQNCNSFDSIRKKEMKPGRNVQKLQAIVKMEEGAVGMPTEVVDPKQNRKAKKRNNVVVKKNCEKQDELEHLGRRNVAGITAGAVSMVTIYDHDELTVERIKEEENCELRMQSSVSESVASKPPRTECNSLQPVHVSDAGAFHPMAEEEEGVKIGRRATMSEGNPLFDCKLDAGGENCISLAEEWSRYEINDVNNLLTNVFGAVTWLPPQRHPRLKDFYLYVCKHDLELPAVNLKLWENNFRFNTILKSEIPNVKNVAPEFKSGRFNPQEQERLWSNLKRFFVLDMGFTTPRECIELMRELETVKRSQRRCYMRLYFAAFVSGPQMLQYRLVYDIYQCLMKMRVDGAEAKQKSKTEGVKMGPYSIDDSKRLMTELLKRLDVANGDRLPLQLKGVHVRLTEEDWCQVSKDLQRSKKSMIVHWNRVILPVLLTHEKGESVERAQIQDWKIELLEMIVNNPEVNYIQDVKYEEINERFPLCTSYQVSCFLSNIQRYQETGADENFKQILSRKLRCLTLKKETTRGKNVSTSEQPAVARRNLQIVEHYLDHINETTVKAMQSGSLARASNSRLLAT